MNCPTCDTPTKKNGKDRSGAQKFRCGTCKKVFTTKEKLAGKKLAADKIELCIRLLVEGNSVRSTERISGVHRDTVLRLLETVGERCLMLQETLVKNVKVSDVEADEAWAYVSMKQKTANARGLGDNERIGSVWTFTAIEKTSKLMISEAAPNRTHLSFWKSCMRPPNRPSDFRCPPTHSKATTTQ